MYIPEIISVYTKDGRGGLQSLQLNASCVAYHGCTYKCIATGVIVYTSMAGSTLLVSTLA